MNKLFLLALVPAISFAQSSANELVVVSNATKGASTISLDLVSSGNAAAIHFELDVGVSDPSLVDLSNCLSSFKAGSKMVSCSLVGSKVIGMVASPDLKAIIAGRVNLGTVTVKAANAKLGQVMWESYDSVGNVVESKLTNAGSSESQKK